MSDGVTRQDLEQALRGLADQLERRFGQMDQRFEHIEQRIERAETTLLTEFHKWARTHEVRSRGVSAAVVGFDERLSIIEDRLSELERRGMGNGRS